MERSLPRRTFPIRQVAALAIVAAVGSALPPAVAGGQPGDKLPAMSAIQKAVQQHFAMLPGYRSGDLIAKGDVQPVFSELKELGWQVEDEQAIVSQVLDDSDFLVSTLRTEAGRRFMRKVSGYASIYDRLDRICRESGGKPLLQSLVRLPDGERYAKVQRPRAVPGLVDLLPKKGSAKTRSVPDYDKPTGRIYTVPQLLERLEQSRRRAESTSPTT